jgi:hypothetical protein
MGRKQVDERIAERGKTMLNSVDGNSTTAAVAVDIVVRA